MSAFNSIIAAAIGSTGNNTHASVRCAPSASQSAFVLVVETGGATPAISWKVQGALDVDGIADGSANWFDLVLIPAGSDTAAAIPIVVSSAVTGTVSAAFLSQAHSRFARRIRIVTTANTNVTYRVEFHQQTL